MKKGLVEHGGGGQEVSTRRDGRTRDEHDTPRTSCRPSTTSQHHARMGNVRARITRHLGPHKPHHYRHGTLIRIATLPSLSSTHVSFRRDHIRTSTWRTHQGHQDAPRLSIASIRAVERWRLRLTRSTKAATNPLGKATRTRRSRIWRSRTVGASNGGWWSRVGKQGRRWRRRNGAEGAEARRDGICWGNAQWVSSVAQVRYQDSHHSSDAHLGWTSNCGGDVDVQGCRPGEREQAGRRVVVW